MRIGVIQGRLLPPEPGHFQAFPRQLWRQEFPFASETGLEFIEWVYDQYGADANPISTNEGIQEMLALSAKHSVNVVSLCADYFMDHPFTTASGSQYSALQEKLIWLFGQCRKAGITRIVLPFVDASSIETPRHADLVKSLLRELLPEAARNNVEIHLETSLNPASLAALLDDLPNPWLKANYDSGNSSSLGYDPAEEFSAYGERIGSIHIKDRIRGGGTVPLGTGDANFSVLFKCIRDSGYQGDYILQVARESPGNEIAWTRQNLAWLKKWLNK